MRANTNSKVKTSKDYPLAINELAVPGASGRLGLTFCPGKKAPSLLDGSKWYRQLDKDIERIANWGASAVVTLMDLDEIKAFEVEDLPACVASAGMEWLHLPIKDAGVPDQYFEWQWRYGGRRIHQLLSQGENVVIHCRGGLGRTGLVAARVLIEKGVLPVSAMRQVRAARPNAIENSFQERYLLKLGKRGVRRCQ